MKGAGRASLGDARPSGATPVFYGRARRGSRSSWWAPSARKAIVPYGLTGPAVLVIVLVALTPAVYGVWLSFTNWQFLQSTTAHFEGIGAYRTIFSSPEFWSDLGHTWFWTAGTLVIEVGVGLPLGLLLSRPTRVSGVATSLLLLPWVTPFVVVSYSWLYLLGSGGPVHSLLQAVGIVGAATPLESPKLALPTLTVISGWKGLPFMTIALLANRRSIDDGLYEAANVDGARVFQRFRYITFPLMRNTIIVMSVVLGVLAFYSFDLVWLLTQGGPGTSSELTGVMIYREFFLNGAPGAAAAIGVSMFVMLIVVSSAVLALTRVNSRDGR
jgi:ABC-type sugar transport system permease subunit